MIDGIKINARIDNLEGWRKSVDVQLFTGIDQESGIVQEKKWDCEGFVLRTISHSGKLQTYSIKLKESEKVFHDGNRSQSVYLSIDGSIHKNHFKGANFQPFTWDGLRHEINYLAENLHINPLDAILENIEIGINIPFAVPVFTFLESNLIAYKGEQFNRYNPDKKGVCLGYVCPLYEYSIKVYDKAKQFNLPGPLLRFEVRFTRMRIPNKAGIYSLADLTDKVKAENLLSILLDAWDNVLIYDPAINIKQKDIKPNDWYLLEKGQHAKFWKELKQEGERGYRYRRSKFRDLVKKYGNDLHNNIRESIENEWQKQFKNCRNSPMAKNPKLSEFTGTVKGEIRQTGTCKWCGKDISKQRLGSRFCRAKFSGGKEVNRCRDKYRKKLIKEV